MQLLTNQNHTSLLLKHTFQTFEQQSSNACLVIGLFGSLTIILKSLKVSLYASEFLSRHFPLVEGPPVGFEEEKVVGIGEKRGASFAVLKDLINGTFGCVGKVCVALSR